MAALNMPGKALYTHDCEACTFLGSGKYNGQECDFYACGNGDWGRSFIARYSSDGPDYSSGGLFECVELTMLDRFALMHGLDLLPVERERLVRCLLTMDRRHWPQRVYENMPDNKADMLGSENLYDLDQARRVPRSERKTK